MALQSRGRKTLASSQNFDLLDTPNDQTPKALGFDDPLINSSSTDEEGEIVDGDNFAPSQYSLDDLGSSGSSDSGSEEEEEEEEDTTQHQDYLHHSNSSFLMANAFAPPFYNRPPTPLPPSPSLTSLLRPPFSTTTSRPTTPDSSDNDTQNDTEAAVAKSARTATTVPRASPKVPTYEYYGFVLYLLSSLGFCWSTIPTEDSVLTDLVMYLLWSYLPSPFLHQLGIYYYPNRWWSLAIPSFLVMTIIYIYVALASYNTGYLTLPMNSIENIVDEAAHVAVLDSRGRIQRKNGYVSASTGFDGFRDFDWKRPWSEGTDAVMDVPMGGVCEILYG